MGHHWGYRRETGEPQITVNYARAFSDFLVNFTFSRGVSFLSPDETAAIVPTRLKRIWEDDNPKMSLLWEIGNMGSVSGDVFVKVAYEEPWTDPGGLPHPGRVRILPLNPSFCFPEFHPHDRKRIIRFKLKYRFWGCVDPETEALTRRGWKKHTDIIPGVDQILALDPWTDEIRWETVQDVSVYPYKGEMHRWTGKVDALTTPNHRWLASNPHGRAHTRRYEREIVFSGMRPNNGRLVTGGGTPVEFADQPKWADELVETVGWYITEGVDHWNQTGFHTIRISQHQDSPHIGTLRRLRKWWQSGGTTCNEWKPTPFGIVDFYFGKGSNRVLEDIAPGKQLTPDFLCSLTAAQARLLYETLMDGDGCRTRGQERWTQTDLGRMAGFQMLSAMLGKRSRYFQQKVTTYFDRYSTIKNIPEEIVDYDGEVWCPSIPSTIWMARRGDTTYWTGNTTLEGTRQVFTYTELLTDETIEEFVNDELIDARPNPLGLIPIVNIANLPVSSSPWGLSDTQDILGLNREFNEKMTEVSTIINYHSAPVTVLIGGKSSNLEKGAKKVWSIPNEKAKIQNLENNPDGAKFAMEYIDRLKTMMHELVGIPVGALGQSQPISNTSGVALAIQFLTTMMRYHLKCTVYGEGLVRINEIALRLLFLKEPWTTMHDPENDPPLEDGQLDHLDPNDLISYRSETQFPPPLPVDRLVKLNEIQVLLALGLESKKGALRDLGEEFVSEKMQELFDELLSDAEHQAALDLMKAQVAAVIAQLTGMYPTEAGPEPVPPPPASSTGSGGVQSAGGPNVNSAGSPGTSGPLPGAVAASILSPADQQGLMQRIVALAAGTQLPQRRSPEPSED